MFDEDLRDLRITHLLLVAALLTVCSCGNGYPAPNIQQIYKQAKPVQPELCYSFCQTCQSEAGELQTCISCERPFLKQIPPICNVSASYTMQAWELWEHQVNSGPGNLPDLFTASGSWSTDQPTASSGYCGGLMLYGPFTRLQQLNFSRTIQAHDFVIVKFFFVRIGWTANDSVSFVYSANTNDSSRVLMLDYVGDGNLSNPNSTALGAYCDNKFAADNVNKDDMVSKIEVKYFDRRATVSELFMSFLPKASLSDKAGWGLNSFLVITGQCDKSCYTCNYDSSPTGCLTCTNLQAQAETKACTLCLDGFYRESETACGRCPITCLRCQNNAGNVECTACPNNFVLKSGACEYTTNNYKIAERELTEKVFEFTFFSITPPPSQVITVCGAYSMVGGLGVTSANSILTRIYDSLSPHVSLAVRFNLYKIDRVELSGRVFVYIDETLLLNTTVSFTGTSQECGQPSVETIATIESEYLSHSNERNVNLSIQTDFSAWGIRNLMLSINNCGPNCADCGSQGCRACSGFMQLVGVTCSGCIEGFVADGPTNCVACKIECLTCELTSTNCTSCFSGFTLVRNTCLPNPDVRVIGNELTSRESQNITVSNWAYVPTTVDDNASNCSTLAAFHVDVLNVPPTTFLVSSGPMKRNYTDLPPHYLKRVRYLLMRVDDWQGDTLFLFLNDLLVSDERFTGEGKSGSSNLCSIPAQNEYVVRREASMKDSNSSLAVEFQVMHINNNQYRRWFGLRDWMVMLELCEECPLLSFSYSVEYTVSDKVSIFMRFNRPLKAYAYGLTFKDIFKVYLQNQQYEYVKERWSEQLFVLRFAVRDDVSTISNGRLRVVCLYPTAVITDSHSILTSMHAEGNATSTSLLKYLDSNHSEVELGRYNSVEGVAAYNCRIALEVFGKIVVYGGLLSFFLGWQSIFVGALHNLQKLWLHIYIASNFLPSNFKVALSGLKIVQDLSFLPVSVQQSITKNLLPENYVSSCPPIYLQYFPDISFARNIYHAAIFALVISVFYGLLVLLYRTTRWLRTSKAWLAAYYCYLTSRPYWLFDSIFYFQYVTAMVAVFAQFIDRAHFPPASSVNLAAAIFAFLFGVGWPIYQVVFLRIREFDPNFSYHYQEIHERFYQTKQRYFMSCDHTLYQYWRWLELMLVVVLAVSVHNPYPSLVLLLLISVMHFIWLVGRKLHNEAYKMVFYLKLLELVCFAAIEIIVLVCYSKYETLDKPGYDNLGTAAISFAFIIVACNVCRLLFGLYKKIMLFFYIPLPEFSGELLGEQLDTTNRY